MSVIQSLFSAVSGLRTASRSLQSSADNVANLRTPGFQKSRVVTSDVVSGGTQVSGIIRDPSPGPEGGSNVDITEEAVNQILAKTAFKANANVIRTADEMIGTILDIKA